MGTNPPPQILDLRERGSETVSHSEGTGIAAFTTKSGSQNSPFAAGHRSKNGSNVFRPHTRGLSATIGSNVLLSTLGSIPPDMDMSMDLSMDIEQDVVEMDDMHIEMDSSFRGSTSTKTVGGGEADAGLGGSPAPPYHCLEMGFKAAKPPSDEGAVSRIRVDIEKTTRTI
jgi:hypothetical protein